MLPSFDLAFVRSDLQNTKDEKYVLSFLTLHSKLHEKRSREMAGRDPPPYLNTPEDRGGVVAVVTFTCLVISTFTNGVRVWNRQLSGTALGLDDVLLVAANVSVTEKEVERDATNHACLCRSQLLCKPFSLAQA